MAAHSVSKRSCAAWHSVTHEMYVRCAFSRSLLALLTAASSFCRDFSAWAWVRPAEKDIVAVSAFLTQSS